MFNYRLSLLSAGAALSSPSKQCPNSRDGAGRRGDRKRLGSSVICAAAKMRGDWSVICKRKAPSANCTALEHSAGLFPSLVTISCVVPKNTQ